MIILLTVGLIKKISLYKMSYFRESHAHRKNREEVELELANYTAKSDLKNATGVDTSQFAKTAYSANFESDVAKLDIGKVPSGLNSLKSKKDKLDVDMLKAVTADLKKSSDVVEKEVVKKDVYDGWVKKLMLFI